MKLFPRLQAPPLTGWTEGLVLPLVAVALSAWLTPTRIFDAPFPWIWLAPLLVALRYGLLPALGSVAVLVLTAMLMQRYGLVTALWSKEQFIGGVLLTAIGGQFGDIWRRRLDRQQFMVRYSQERLQALTRDFYITRLSHDILEQNLITEPATLRNALQDLHRLLDRDPAERDGEAVRNLMDLLGFYGRLETAALFPYDGERLENRPLAVVGRPGPLHPGDPLVTAALEKEGNAYYSVAQLVEERTSRYLAVLPLRSYSGRYHGLLVVEDMPFLSLNEETLLMLAAILGYFADEIDACEHSRPIRAHLPDCPPRFAKELLQLAHLKFLVGMDSVLLTLLIPAGPLQRSVLEILERTKRGLDLHWQLDTDTGPVVLFKLMPLTRSVGAEGFLHRLEALLEQRLDTDLERAGLKVRYEAIPTVNLTEWLIGKRTQMQAMAQRSVSC